MSEAAQQHSHRESQQESQQRNIAVVMDGPSGQRLVERLARSGLAVRVVLPDALSAEASAGRFYLAPLGMAPDADALARRGAHLCLIPPWPAEIITIGVSRVGVAPVEQRGVAHFSAAMRDDAPDQADSGITLKILYRERLIGNLGTALAESEPGEPLLATLPRASNLHGYVMVSALQLSVASAQTRFDDVARLLTRLQHWCAAHAEPTPPTGLRNDEPETDDSGEQFAPIVLLALALAARGSDMAHRETVRNTFGRVCEALGQPVESPAFARGWAWLEAHRVVSHYDGDEAQIQRDALEHYSALWQLAPRLRRMRQYVDGE